MDPVSPFMLSGMRILLSLTIIFFVHFLSGCGGSGDPSPVENDKDRKLILANWADNVIVPSYLNFKTQFDIMIDRADAFTNSPDETSLTEFRAAWADAYASWQRVELFEFGPADKYTLRNFFNIYPADEAGIAAGISDPNSSLELATTYARQGFPALDYLLHGVAQDDNSVLALYTTDADASKRIAYLKRITARMETLLTLVISEWNGPYRDTFISKTGLDIGSSTGSVVNAFVLHYERYIRSGKFGIPSGATIASGGVPHPEKVEAYYKKDISRMLAKNAHEAVAAFFNGKYATAATEGPSFKSYLDGLGAKDPVSGTLLSEVINLQFDTIGAKLDLLSPSLYEQVQTDNQAMIDVYNEMQKIVRMLKVDMTSAMSVTITYTDNDGD
jgi:predicted lipoprotein